MCTLASQHDQEERADMDFVRERNIRWEPFVQHLKVVAIEQESAHRLTRRQTRGGVHLRFCEPTIAFGQCSQFCRASVHSCDYRRAKSDAIDRNGMSKIEHDKSRARSRHRSEKSAWS